MAVHHVPVGGTDVYVDDRGSGHPVVLLHGGLMTVDLTFGTIVPALARDHRTIGIELQGHGHTADSERPMGLADLAGDVAAVLAHLGIERADVFGFSLGGFEHADDPEVARRLPTEEDFRAMREAFVRVAPDPDQFDAIAAKTSGMVHALEGWPDRALLSIGSPTLIIVGDTDFVPLAHAADMLRLVPHAQLAVLPGTTHMEVTRRTAPVLALVEAFLDRRH
jgi:pimeloyl-ACP methyl ester carboxylesterase